MDKGDFNGYRYGDPIDRMDAACALYWYAAEFHEGQSSWLYSILSTLGYQPGAMESGPSEDGSDRMLYDALASGDEDAEDVLRYIERTKGAD